MISSHQIYNACIYILQKVILRFFYPLWSPSKIGLQFCGGGRDPVPYKMGFQTLPVPSQFSISDYTKKYDLYQWSLALLIP